MSNHYAEDGVNVHEEASFSAYAGTVCKGTYTNSPFVDVVDLSEGNFRGPRPFTLKNLPDGYMVEASSDGLGTKGILIDAAHAHETAAFDLVAMVSSDITRYGGVPLVILNVLDLASVGEENDAVSHTYKKLFTGLQKATKETNMVALKGETAQMGVAVGSDISDSPTRFNWSAVGFGAYHPNKMITGKTLAAGQVIIALRERGFRSNGISSVRAAFKKQFGSEWWKHSDAQEHLKAAAAPSVLYDAFINTLHGWFAPDFAPEVTLHAITHLSGGGIKEKLGNDLLFPRGLSAVLDNLYEPPAIMKKCAEWRGLTDEEFYATWNGGQGMLLLVNPEDANHVVTRAKDFNIEAQIAGTILKNAASDVRITSQLSDNQVIYTA